MAYIHCGNKNCSFSQDDFWTFRFKPRWKFWEVRSIFGYSPYTVFAEDFSHLITPRWILFDQSIVDQIFKEHKFKLKTRTKENQEIKPGYIGFSYSIEVWSWSLLIWEFKRMLIKIHKQKWRTYKQYLNDKNKLCPKCHSYIPSSCID